MIIYNFQVTIFYYNPKILLRALCSKALTISLPIC